MRESFWRRIFVALFVVPAMLLGLGGCTIATPFKLLPPAADSAPSSDAIAHVSITFAKVDVQNRGRFDAYVARLSRILPNQPGLIGYSLRQELFGDELWTVTAWQSNAARTAFVRGELHLEAIREGGPALIDTRFARAEIKIRDLPLAWPRALEILEKDGFDY
jgi:heme-degrading monooxygenase HmoA